VPYALGGCGGQRENQTLYYVSSGVGAGAQAAGNDANPGLWPSPSKAGKSDSYFETWRYALRSKWEYDTKVAGF